MMRVFLILLAFTLSGALHAAEPQKQQAAKEDPYLKRFQELDRDKNGYVTPGEWPLAPESFAVVDRGPGPAAPVARALSPLEPSHAIGTTGWRSTVLRFSGLAALGSPR